jgi:hypothetical protein
MVDHENYVLKKTASENLTKEEKKELKQQEKKYKRLNGMLTPMSKYYASEMSNRICYDAVQVLGGSGYMKDYPVERHTRDARITSIYEGTTQLQLLAAVRGVCGGVAEKFLQEKEQWQGPEEVADLMEILKQGRERLNEAVQFVKEQPGTEYMDLYGRQLVDIAIMLIVGHLFLQQSCSEPAWRSEFTDEPVHDNQEGVWGNGPIASAMAGEMKTDSSDNHEDKLAGYSLVRKHKGILSRRYIPRSANKIEALYREIVSADRSSMGQFSALVDV